MTKNPTTPGRARSPGSDRPVTVKRPQSLEVRVRTSEVRDEARRLDQLVTDAEEITVVGKDNRRVPVAGALLKALATVTSALGRGATVTVTEANQFDLELTSQQAADLLNVSRPYVIKLAREGVLPHRRVGNRHRFTLPDVLEHRGRMRATAEKALADLAPVDGYTAADF